GTTSHESDWAHCDVLSITKAGEDDGQRDSPPRRMEKIMEVPEGTKQVEVDYGSAVRLPGIDPPQYIEQDRCPVWAHLSVRARAPCACANACEAGGGGGVLGIWLESVQAPGLPEASQRSPRWRRDCRSSGVLEPNANAEGLAGRVEATQVCSGSRGPGQPLPAAREGGGAAGGIQDRGRARGQRTSSGRQKARATRIPRSGQRAHPLVAGRAVLEPHDSRDRHPAADAGPPPRTPPTPEQQAPGRARGPRGFQDPPLTGGRACVRARAGPGGWLRGVEVSTRPRSLSGASPDPMRCSGPRGPGVGRLRRPPPPNPRGPGASEPPAGLGAAKLERPTCAAPVRCPKPTRSQEGAVERSASAPPLRTTEAPPCPPRQALDLPERADEPQAGTQTDTQTLARTHAKGDSWPAQAPQPEPERLERPGPDERAGGWLSGDTEAEIHEDSETDSKTARGDTDTHHTTTHTTHLSVVFGITSVRSCWLSPTLIRPMDCGPSGSSVRGISQARILEWVAISFYGRHLPTQDRTPISWVGIPCHLNQDIANSLGKIQRIELVFY
ncbi:unnamed protein product, partial [Ceratitis capitata]